MLPTINKKEVNSNNEKYANHKKIVFLCSLILIVMVLLSGCNMQATKLLGMFKGNNTVNLENVDMLRGNTTGNLYAGAFLY